MTRINVDLSDLLAPIKQMREEIQKMNEALRSTVQLQAQMAAQQRQASGGYSPTRAGLALEIQDRVATRGGPLSNVYSIGTGAPIVPPTNLNPAGIRQSPVDLFGQQLGAARQGVNIVTAMAGQAGIQSAQSKKEMEELHKVLRNHADKSGQLISNFLSKSQSDLSEVSTLLAEKKRELALAMAANAENVKDLTDSADELSKKFNQLKVAVDTMTDAAQEFRKQTGGGGGEGGGGDTGGWWSKYAGMAGRGIAGLAATTAFGFQMASAYSGMQALGYQQNLAALREIPQNIATAESLQFQRYMTLAAPTTGAQFVEAFGNILTPGERPFQYLGVGNRQAVRSMADRMFTEELSASKAEQGAAIYGAFSSGINQITSGATTTAGGILATGMGAPALGIPLMAQGAGNILSAPIGTLNTMLQAQTGLYGQSQGGYANAPFAGFLFDNATRAADEQRTRFFSYRAAREEENQRFLINAESQSIRARRLAMGIDEQLAALRMQTAATAMAGGAAVTGFEPFNAFSQIESPELRRMILSGPDTGPNKLISKYANLGYSITDVGQIYNQYASIMGTTRGAGNLLGLTRAGVGTAEQLASNVLGISSVSGKAGDMKQLENIFAKAFETGLRGAPSIQRFTQAALEMSSALKLQSAGGAATMLSTLTSAMAGKTGSPLMYLNEAQSGISALAAATGATTGMMGTMKVLSGAAQGLGVGAMGLTAGSNIIQVQEALGQLSGPVSDYTKLTGLARQLVGVQIRAGMSPKEAINKAREVLQAQSGAQTAPFASAYKLISGGKDLSAVQAEARALLKAGKSEQLRNLFAEFKGETAGIAGLEAEGAAEALLLTGLPTQDFKKGKAILEQSKAAGAAKAAADAATVNYKRILSQAALEAMPGMKQTNVEREKLLETAQSLNLRGTPEEQIAQLKQAAGVDKDKPISFGQLSSAISVLAGKDSGVGTRISVVEDFGDLAVAKLSYAIMGKNLPKNKNFTNEASVNATTVPKEEE